MHGCELAESLATAHRSRPCFKKIDSLCARMKQDLVRPDSVLANINSQGIAWAVKDFIFVFTRIISAWIIIKGYVYNTPDGLAKVKATLSDDFFVDFAEWEDSTIKFISSIISSFVNLDEMVQSQRACYQKSSDSGTKNTAKNSNDTGAQSAPGMAHRTPNSDPKRKTKSVENSVEYLRELLLVTDALATKSLSPKKGSADVTVSQTMFNNVEANSEETQLKSVENGTYFKTGLYNPLQKESSRTIVPETKSIFTTSAGAASPKLLNDLDLSYFEQLSVAEANAAKDVATLKMSRSVDNIFGTMNERKLPPVASEQRMSIGGGFADEMKVMASLPAIGSEKKFMSGDSPTKIDDGLSGLFDNIMAVQIEYLLKKISNLNESKYFFVAQFTNNYVRLACGYLDS